MAWVQVASGPSIDTLNVQVADFELPKGTPVRMVLDLRWPVGWAFDLPGAEILFRQQAPPGLLLKGVYSEGWSKAVIEYEVDPAWLVAVVVFVKAHWLLLTIAGFTMLALVRGFRIETLEEVVKAIPSTAKWVGLAILGLLALTATKYLPERRKE